MRHGTTDRGESRAALPYVVALAVVVTVALGQPATSLGPSLSDETGWPDRPSSNMRVDAAVLQTVSVTIPVGPYQITARDTGHEISVEGFGYLLVPGRPKLPSRIFAIAIPPGAEVTDVEFELGEGVVLPGTYDVLPAPLPRVIGAEDPLVYEDDRKRYEENHASVYGRDDVYPPRVVEFVRPAGYRSYRLADVRVTPFAYRPISRQLTYYPHVNVKIFYTVPSGRDTGRVDHLERKERIARDIILNYDQAQSWYPRETRGGRGLHDFVIITPESMTSPVAPLVDWETAKGRTVEVVTTKEIELAYTGYDLAEQIRNFLRDKYPSEEWGIEDVLLVGHYDDVPMRRAAVDLGYGQPETDFYYAELSLPDSESWDADGDHQYGEYSDPIDFYAEVNVGRIPWSDSSTVLSICNKSVAYEQTGDPAFKKNMLLLGAYFWPNTDNAVLMEAKVDQPWMDDWTLTRMYEKNADYWSSYPCDYPLLPSNVMAVWPAGQYAFVNWAGHGSATSTHIYGLWAPAFITSNDCPALNDNYPAIIFADACSNSETDHATSIGREMIKQGAVGFVGATKVAFGCGGWNDPYDGSSQSLDYYFTTAVTSGDYPQGAALQWALQQMYIYGLWGSLRFETFEWAALWGNPNLGMAAPSVIPPAAEVGPPCGVASDCSGDCAGADCVGGTCYTPKNRYLSIDPTTNEQAVAYRVELTEAADYPTAVGRSWWVEEPACHDFPDGNVVEPKPATCTGPDRFGWVSGLTSTPVTRVWTELPLHLTGCGIAPLATYEIWASADEGGHLSATPLQIGTVHDSTGESQTWGDVTGGPVEGTPGLWLPPERTMNFADVGNAIRTFENRTEDTGFPPRVWVDMEIDQVINLADISFIVMAFEGRAYADIGLPLIGIHPADCP